MKMGNHHELYIPVKKKQFDALDIIPAQLRIHGFSIDRVDRRCTVQTIHQSRPVLTDVILPSPCMYPTKPVCGSGFLR